MPISIALHVLFYYWLYRCAAIVLAKCSYSYYFWITAIEWPHFRLLKLDLNEIIRGARNTYNLILPFWAVRSLVTGFLKIEDH